MILAPAAPPPPSASDLRAGRLLLGATQVDLAKGAGVSPLTIVSLEAGRSMRPSTVQAVTRLLIGNGVEFRIPGSVYLGDRRAPTREAVGVLTGARMRAGRFGVRRKVSRVAMDTGVLPYTINKMEALADCDHGVRPDQLYLVFLYLEREGWFFGTAEKHDHLSVKRAGWALS
jgi:transcriptional regulator with XRE-family HTH domain